jgi:3-oxoacyl-[acyl-carrier-protein] synthase II
MRRVVITGMGVVTPLGHHVDQVFERILAKDCAIEPITAFDTSQYKVKLAAEVSDLNMEAYFSARDLKFNDRYTQFARIASKMAIENANLDVNSIDKDRFGVIMSTGIGGIGSFEKAMESMMTKGVSRVSPFFIPMTLVNLAAGIVAIDHQAMGECSCVVTGCAAGTSSIGEAYMRIKNDQQDIMIAGASEASITPLGVGGFMAMRALSESTDKTRASIPFDRDRSGFVMGEGAGAVIVEELEHALRRKAEIVAEIVGYGSACDAYHMTAPSEDGSGIVKAMNIALKQAQISTKDIGYINAHGTSTPLNDKTEAIAIRQVFKSENVPVSSTKSHMGHLLGACGAVETIICVKSLLTGWLPPTIHLEPDPQCDLDIITEKRFANIRYAMCNNLGFGGHNVSLIVKKWDPDSFTRID